MGADMTDHDELDRIAREVCDAIGSTNGHGTVYAALREVRDRQDARALAERDRRIAELTEKLAATRTLAAQHGSRRVFRGAP